MPRCRKFKLIDAMILTAASAGWMTMSRRLWAHTGATYDPISADHWLNKVGLASVNGFPLYAYIGPFHLVLTYAVMMLAVAYLAIRSVPPRLPESDLFCQPGVISFGLLVGTLFVYMTLAQLELLIPWADLILTIAVGVTWSAACWCYRSDVEPGWIEALGKLFGISLILSIAMNHVSAIVI